MVIAIIPARGGSKRIPYKNGMNFCGKPLVAWTIEQTLRSKRVDEVYVSTEDKEIKKIAEKFGAKVIDRPTELARDRSTAEDVLKHAINDVEKNTKKKIDLVVFMQPTSVLRETKDIDNAVETLTKNNADSLFAAGLLKDFYIWRKNNQDELYSLNYDYKNRGRGQEFGNQYAENGSIYVFKPEILFKNNNRLGGKIAVSLMDFWKSFEIDELEDIKFCKDLFILKGLDKK